MKKILFVICASMVFIACGNKSQSASTNEETANDSTRQTTVSVEKQEVEADPENVLIKISRPTSQFNKQAYEVELRLLADGVAKFQFVTLDPKNYPEEGEDPFYRDTVNQEGSWKEIKVKRGKVYLNAYEIGINSGDLYCTEKFDYLWGIGDDMPYLHFSDGQTGYAWKIDKAEKY